MSNTTKTFHFTVHYEQDEDGIYIADVPTLPGCHSFGETIEEAEQNIQEAITGYLAMLNKQGKPFPTEKSQTQILKKKITVSIPV